MGGGLNDKQFKSTYRLVTDLRVGDEFVYADYTGFAHAKVIAIGPTSKPPGAVRDLRHFTVLVLGEDKERHISLNALLSVLVSYSDP